jgi:hypothetical protein
MSKTIVQEQLRFVMYCCQTCSLNIILLTFLTSSPNLEVSKVNCMSMFQFKL